MIGFYKSFWPFFLKGLHIHFNPSQNVFTILLLNGLVMVKNKDLIVCQCFKKGDVWGYLLYYCVFRSYLKYFKYGCNNKSSKFNLFFISKLKFDRFDGRMVNEKIV